LAAIEALETAKAMLEGQLIDAYGAFHVTLGQVYNARAEGPRSKVPISVDSMVGQEIAIATGVGPGEVSRRLRLATSGSRHAPIRNALREGRISLYRALQTVTEARDVTDADQPDRETQLLDQSKDRDGNPCSQRAFSSRLRRLVRGADPRGQAERRAAAKQRRCAYGRIGEDGMGSLTVIAAAERIAAALGRADAVARRARAAGDPRTLEQLRSDFMMDALMFGWPTDSDPDTGVDTGSLVTAADAGPAGGPAAASPQDDGITDPADGVPEGAAGGPDAPAGVAERPVDGPDGPASGPEPPADGPDASAGASLTGSDCLEDVSMRPGLWLGRPPPAQVWIVVPFEVAAGLSDAPCELPGYGWVTAEHAREIITAPGSMWHQLSVDVDTGYALKLESRGYQPSPELVAQVRARDGVCRGPGCDLPADRTDFDHEVPWPEGATSYVNGYAKERFCHMSKTARLWHSQPDGEHGLKWATLAGREYLTYPKNWLEALEKQPSRDGPEPPQGDTGEAEATRAGDRDGEHSASGSGDGPPDAPAAGADGTGDAAVDQPDLPPF
jgi:hypothetical protein